MITLLLLLSNITFAQEQSINEFCFNSKATSETVLKKVKFILLPQDKSTMDNNCFTILSSEERRELIHHYVRNVEPNFTLKYSSSQAQREPCRIKVEKVYALKKDQKNASVWPNISVGSTQTNAERAEISQVTTTKAFEFFAHQNLIKGECRFINANLYEIKLEAAKIQTPPPPTVVLGHNPELLRPKDEKLQHLATTIQLSRGERLHVGSALKNSDQSQKDLKTTQLAGQVSEGLETEEIYISLE